MSDAATPATEAADAAPAPVPDHPVDNSLTVPDAASIENAALVVGDLVAHHQPDRFGSPGDTVVRYGIVLGPGESGWQVGWFAGVSPSVPTSDLQAL